MVQGRVFHLEDVFQALHGHFDDLDLVHIQQVAQGLDAPHIHQVPAPQFFKLATPILCSARMPSESWSWPPERLQSTRTSLRSTPPEGLSSFFAGEEFVLVLAFIIQAFSLGGDCSVPDSPPSSLFGSPPLPLEGKDCREVGRT